MPHECFENIIWLSPCRVAHVNDTIFWMVVDALCQREQINVSWLCPSAIDFQTYIKAN